MKSLLWIGAAALAVGLTAGFALHRAQTAPAPLTTGPASASSVASFPAGLGPASPAVTEPPVTLDQAKADIEKTLLQEPKNYELRVKAAEFFMRVGAHSEAIPHLQVATRLSPKEFLPWLALGDASTLTGKFPLAASAYARAAAIKPDDPLLIRGRSQLLVRQKRFAEAQRLLESGLKQHPGDTEIRTALGNLFLVLNKPKRATEVIKPALAAAPGRADLHYLLADAYERDLHLEAAISELREAVRLEPRMDEAWGRLGLYLVNLTRYQEARYPLEKAIQLNPTESHYRWVLGDSYLLDKTGGDLNKAIELYEKALTLDPKNEKVLYSYAMALTRHGEKADLQKAVALFQRLLQLNSEDTNVNYKLAECYRRLGRPDEAKPYMAKFQVLFEKGRKQTRQLYQTAAFRDTPQAHVELGRQHLVKGDYKLAATEFQIALERDPGLKEAREGLRTASARLSSPGTRSGQ
jgi:tetratricopeptide (TPR) repeat protein